MSRGGLGLPSTVYSVALASDEHSTKLEGFVKDKDFCWLPEWALAAQ
jgi:hypothetical protein